MKKITYCRETKDFEMRYDDGLVGYAKTHAHAERLLDEYVYRLFTHELVWGNAASIDKDVLEDVVEEAICTAPQMAKQIDQAAAYIKHNAVVIYGSGVLIESSRGEKIYHTNEHCQCEAYVHKKTCWHRIAARLVKRCLERQATCDYCQGMMRLTHTPANEPIWECRGCGHCVMEEIRKAA